jgi:hypothetical protein
MAYSYCLTHIVQVASELGIDTEAATKALANQNIAVHRLAKTPDHCSLVVQSFGKA